MYGNEVVRKIFIVTADSIEERLWRAIERGEEAVEEEESQTRPAESFVFNPESLRVNGGDKAEEDAEMDVDAESKAELEFLRRVDNFTVADADAPMRQFVVKKAGPGEEAGQVPSWLDRSIATREKIDVVHHSAFFKHKNNLPVFNSVAIESQLHRIPGLSDVFIYLNDDMIFGMPASQADFWTPQYGFVFQLLLHDRRTPFPTDFKGTEPLHCGYDENIRYANLQLSRRFGFRYRPLIAHIGQVVNRSILEEAEALWPKAFFQSEKSRFRFSHDGHSLQIMFLMAHYTIERLRETQLRSFWRYRVDYDGNGTLEWEERWALFAMVMDWSRSGDRANLARMGLKLQTTPDFITDNKDVLHRTGYRDAGQAIGVAYKVSGMDGSPHMMSLADTSITIDINDKTRQTEALYSEPNIPPAGKECRFDLDFCLGPKFMTRHGTLSHQDGEEVFKRLAFKEYHCGDCLLQIVLQSDRGVEHFRERIEDAEDDDWGDRVPFTAPVDIHTGRPSRRPSAKRQQPPRSILTPVYRQEMDDVAYDLRRLHNFGKKKKRHRYTKHKRGISAILPSSTQHPKARTRVLQDLYRYNYVVGKSHHVFGVFDNLRNSKRIIESLHDDRWWNKPHHMLSLNDAVVLDKEGKDSEEEKANGMEIRRLMKEFLEDWYGAPSPWEKAQSGGGGTSEGGAREEEEGKEKGGGA
ncbi:Xanthine phosphoribosyltransferase 1 [Linnemannia exigua]|uniref:Xanthine phosphoribosyltransferase 1 n=1 Tax=Linnemannia exigua TaxID=604196 RepID=A0AAD4D4Y6_9FUNG|nr:Xanthine phosphoribosyltransferase 1 [Linnemannia exigua]